MSAVEGRPRFTRHSAGDAVEPARQRLTRSNRLSLADQNEKRCLKGILDIGLFRENPAASGRDQARMSADKSGDRGFVVLAEKAIQKFGVAQGLGIGRPGGAAGDG